MISFIFLSFSGVAIFPIPIYFVHLLRKKNEGVGISSMVINGTPDIFVQANTKGIRLWHGTEPKLLD